MKKILMLIIFNTFLFGNLNVEKIKLDFNKNVIEFGIYKKIYKKILDKKCKKEDFQCFDNFISKIKQYDENNRQYIFDYYENNEILFKDEYFKKIEKKLKKDINKLSFKKSEFLTVVDLKNQILTIIYFDVNEQKYYKIGSDYISSGNIEKEKQIKYGQEHYLNTPTGVFRKKSGWRTIAKDKKGKESLSYGYKDRYVYYFGKYITHRYDTFTKNRKKIYNKKNWKIIKDKVNFAMHSYGYQTEYGYKASHGCIRTSDQLIRFLDENMILHKKILKRYKRKTLKKTYKKYAGEYLVIYNKV